MFTGNAGKTGKTGSFPISSGGLAHPTEAAPPFAVFEGWVLRRSVDVHPSHLFLDPPTYHVPMTRRLHRSGSLITEAKKIEKLRYIHRNPVRRGLVLEPEQWAWSSVRWYAHGESGAVLVNEQRRAELKLRAREGFGGKIE